MSKSSVLVPLRCLDLQDACNHWERNPQLKHTWHKASHATTERSWVKCTHILPTAVRCSSWSGSQLPKRAGTAPTKDNLRAVWRGTRGPQRHRQGLRRSKKPVPGAAMPRAGKAPRHQGAESPSPVRHLAASQRFCGSCLSGFSQLIFGLSKPFFRLASNRQSHP